MSDIETANDVYARKHTEIYERANAEVMAAWEEYSSVATGPTKEYEEKVAKLKTELQIVVQPAYDKYAEVYNRVNARVEAEIAELGKVVS